MGVHRANTSERREKRSRFVEGILKRFPILGIELHVARIHAVLAAELAQKATTIGYQDLWIAATALNYDYAVMTTNSRIGPMPIGAIHISIVSILVFW